MTEKLSPAQKEFHLEEFKQIRAEVASVVDQAWKIFYYSIIFCAGFFGWIVTNRQVVVKDHVERLIDSDTWHIIVWIPPIVSLGALALTAGLYLRVIEIGTYLKKIEQFMSHPKLGWEKDRDSRILKHTKYFVIRGISKTAAMMGVCWILFVATNLLFARLMLNK